MKNMDSDSDLEMIQTVPAKGTPAGTTPPAGSIQALCPAWKRGHCIGEGWCLRQHPQPAAEKGVLPPVGYGAARATLRCCLTQGWIQDETTRGSVNIIGGRQQGCPSGADGSGPAQLGLPRRPGRGNVMEPAEDLLVLATDMVRGVLDESRVQRARPQWTIQVYTPPGGWSFSTCICTVCIWAYMYMGSARRHAAPGTRGHLHGQHGRIGPGPPHLAVDQDFPRRRPEGGLWVPPAVEGLSLGATLQRHANQLPPPPFCRQAQS